MCQKEVKYPARETNKNRTATVQQGMFLFIHPQFYSFIIPFHVIFLRVYLFLSASQKTADSKAN